MLSNGSFSADELLQLLRMDTLAYSQAMALDPLLPKELHPEGYTGEKVFMTHQKLVHQITHHGSFT
jgi:DNA-binding transcriptional regulator PaaX